jgi:hypothetical protein
VFTSAGAKAPGTWKGIFVYGTGDARLVNVIVEHAGGQEDRAAIFVDQGGALTLEGGEVRGNTTGLLARDAAKLRELDGVIFAGNTEAALRIHAGQLARIGARTRLVGEKVEVLGGEVRESGTWHALGASVEVTDDVSVRSRAVLTLAEGLELAFRSGVELSVGYTDTAGLKAIGTAGKPIRLRGVDADPGSWDGVILYEHARDVVLEHVVIEGSGGSGGVVARRGSAGRVASLACRRCAEAAVWRECEAKLELAGVTAEEGTPVAEKRAEGCE